LRAPWRAKVKILKAGCTAGKNAGVRTPASGAYVGEHGSCTRAAFCW
jgi:hypothetical protein